MRKVVLIAAATGRDHMIAKSLSMYKDVELSVIIWADSNYIKKLCTGEYHVIDLNNIKQVCDIIKGINPDYVIPGQGDILQQGLTDILKESNIFCIGPVKKQAQIEGSKAFMRSIMENINDSLNPKYKDFFRYDNSVVCFINSFDSDIVLKCDHVISGPRVRIFKRAFELDKALSNAEQWIKKYGHILIEEFMDGEEIALTTYTDGISSLHTPLTRNHKRVFDNNVGENTSGMGSMTGYNCFDFLPDDIYSRLKLLNESVLDELNRITDDRYIGSIYGEFIVNKNGIKVIEYNCRFGNPCSLNIFSLLNYPIINLFDAIVNKKLNKMINAFSNRVSMSAYVVPTDYTILENHVGSIVDFSLLDMSTFFYGNMLYDGKKYLLKNSRAFAVCAIGQDVEEARNILYNELSKVKGNIHYRKDIGVCKW